MIEIDHRLKAHLESRITTVCYVWIIERCDGAKLGFTDHDKALEIAGVICEPQSGMDASAVENSAGLSGDTSDISGALVSERISETDIEAHLYDGAEICLWLVNWKAPDQTALLREFQIGEIVRQDQSFKVELRSLAGNLDQQSGRYFVKRCDADLGDGRCKVDISSALYQTAGTVLANAQNGLQSFHAEISGTHSKDWFVGGTLVWPGGPMAGHSYTVANIEEAGDHVKVSTVEALRAAPASGASFNLVAGCDKRFATCKAKFSNHLNFRGFPHMPGNENALNYLDRETLLDGGPIVP